MFRIITLLAVASVSSLAMASVDFTGQFTGHWKANYGQLSTSFGTKVPCKNIEMHLSQTDEAFVIESYKAECNFFSTAWGPNEMTLQGEKVFGMQGGEIGTLKGNVLLTKERLGTVDHAFNLKLETNREGTEILKSYYGIRNAAGVTAMEGELHRLAK